MRSTERRLAPNIRHKRKRKKKKHIYNINTCTTSFKRSKKIKKSDKIHFQGGCIDTGAQRTVIGKKQALAICQSQGTKLKLIKSNTIFKFGNGRHNSLGILKIRIPTRDGAFIDIDADVVRPDVPVLIGIDILDREQLVPDNVNNRLQSHIYGWSIPITRKNGHMYITWNESQIFFNRRELYKMHRHFHHPSPGKLLSLIKRSNLTNVDANTKQILEEISQSCSTCQTFSSKPQRFKVSLPNEKIIFNREVALDLMWLENKAVLHVVDIDTHFNSAKILSGQTVESVWEAFLECWTTLYTGFPDKIKVDQGSAFTSVRWTRLCDRVGVTVQESGIEHHNALGSGERYHDPLRRIFRKIRHESPNMSLELALRTAVKAMNDTLGPEGLVPTLLVFGCLPRFPTVSSELPAQRERMRALSQAKKEMATITAELRIKRALMSRVPRNADLVLEPGDQIKVYRETDRKYIGPFPVIRIDKKQVFVLHGNVEKAYSLHQVIRADRFERIINGDAQLDDLKEMMTQFITEPSREYYGTFNVHITEILEPSDPRANSEEAKKAKKRELEELIRRGTWKIVAHDELPKGANIMSGGFVVTIKDIETDKPRFKARFVIHGNQDKEKNQLVHTSSTIKHASTRLLIALAACFGFRIWSQDISQAYLQSAIELLRDIYLKPGKDFEMEGNTLLKLLRPLYGLSDSGDYWHTTFSDHIKNDLDMKETVADYSFFFKKARGKLLGLMGTYVDDTITSGSETFEKETELTSKKFECKKKEYDNFRFAGIYIRKLSEGYSIHQESYIKRLEYLDSKCTFKQFRSARARLTWIQNSRPEIAATVNFLSQCTEKTFTGMIKLFNDTVRNLQNERSRGLFMRKLDLNTVHVKVFSDAAFANNTDLSSQLGFICLLCDQNDNCNIINFSSHKSRRIVRSVLGGEVYAFADAFDSAYTLKMDLENILERKISLQMFTDSKSLFDIITKCSGTTEKRLLIDIKAVREAYERFEVSDVGFVRSENNPADAFTKIKCNSALFKILKNNKCDFEVEQWIIRTKKKKKEVL